MKKIGMHYQITGRVQGVCFRAATTKKANALELTGWVRNTHEGGVEIKAFGNEDALHELFTWLHKGPLLAKVTDIQSSAIAYESLDTFEIID